MTVSSSFSSLLGSCQSIIEGADEHPLLKKSDLEKTLVRLEGTLEEDLKHLKKQEFLFSSSADVSKMTGEVVDFIRSWHVLGQPPSLAALCAAAADHFGIEDKTLRYGLVVASILGEVESDLDYHNNNHFRKVVMQLIRMMNAHNRIYAGTEHELTPEDIALVLITGAIHDVGHDGLGNTVKGVFHQSRLELRSFELAWPYLEALGFEARQKKVIEAMLIATDVSPFGDPESPMMQMKAAYRFHFLGEKAKFPQLNLSPELSILEKDSKVALMACMVHEADIATSSGLSYAVSQYETVSVFNEMGQKEASPQDLVSFIDNVCQRRYLSDVGQKLFASNLARIYALAEQDVKAGNQPFPKAQHTDFILGVKAGEGEGKPLN